MNTANKLHRLNCTWLRRTFVKTGGGFSKCIKSVESDSTYFFEGKTKKECIEKAKKSCRYGANYSTNWEIVDSD